VKAVAYCFRRFAGMGGAVNVEQKHKKKVLVFVLLCAVILMASASGRVLTHTYMVEDYFSEAWHSYTVRSWITLEQIISSKIYFSQTSYDALFKYLEDYLPVGESYRPVEGMIIWKVE